MHHDDRLGSPKRRFGRLLEGMIERGLQLRIGWLDHRRSGDIRQKRRRPRHLQRLQIASQQIGWLRAMKFDAALAFVKRRTAAEKSKRRCVDGFGGCIKMVAEQLANPADTGTVVGLRKHPLRLEAGDKDFDAEVMGDETGGDANSAIGAEDDRRCRDACQQERRGHNAGNKLPRNHVSSLASGISVPSAPHPPKAAPAR
jgi:hypothetical protein